MRFYGICENAYPVFVYLTKDKTYDISGKNYRKYTNFEVGGGTAKLIK